MEQFVISSNERREALQSVRRCNGATNHGGFLPNRTIGRYQLARRGSMAIDARNETAQGVARLLNWAAALDPGHIPTHILERATLVLVDNVAAMVAATGESQVIKAQAAFRCTTAAAEATVMAPGAPRLDRYSAAAANGMAAVWTELDEGYRIAPCHAGAYAIPAGLAEAEAESVDTRRLLAAIVVSYEINARLARTFPFKSFSVHPHGCFAAIGAAASVAHLRRLNARDFTSAVTGAASMAYAGPFSHAVEGTLSRNAWTGIGAWTGMRAVDLALAGIGGATNAPFDVFVGCFKSEVDVPELERALGHDWAISDGYHKLYACCQYAHSAVEANIELAHRAGSAPTVDEIEEIIVETHPKGLTLITVEPGTVLAAKFSMPHILAATAVFGTGSAMAFTERTLADPQIAGLRRRVRLVPHTSIAPWPNDRPARVTWRFRDGECMSAESINARGGADQPFSIPELMTKARDLTAQTFPAFSVIAERLVGDPGAWLDRPWNEVIAEMTSATSAPIPLPRYAGRRNGSMNHPRGDDAGFNNPWR